ncbi:MAG TPA: BamA/TamA family outer membrane protein [Methylomirabilota bacterium]|nr:BamA/TamA family outer membrane protein [Methylomirabilota bacterium]
MRGSFLDNLVAYGSALASAMPASQQAACGISLAVFFPVMRKVLVRGSFWLLWLWLSSNTVLADVTPGSFWKGVTGYLDPRGWPFIPIPEVGTDPNGETTIGILPVFLFLDEKKQINRIFNFDVTYNPTLGVGTSAQILSYPSADTQWSATAGIREHIDRYVDLAYATGLNRDRWWSFEGRLLFERDPTDRFFGFGNHSDSDNETNYTIEQEYVFARFGLNFRRDLQLALDLRPRFVRIERGAFDTLPFTGTQFPTLKGLRRGSNELLSRIFLTYDTRNSRNVPTQGSLISLWGGITDRAFLSSVSYSAFGLDARHYQPLHPRVILVGHVAFQYMPVGRDAPFWALSRLGGDRTEVGYRQPLRGFGEARFVDRNLFAAAMELRTRVYERDIFGTHGVLELAPFVDLGRVFHSMNTNPLSGLHPVGGLGFRGIATPFVVGYVDIGYGSEGVAVFSGVNYPF